MARKTRRAPVSRDKRFRRAHAADTGTPELWQHTGRVWEYTDTAGVFAARATEEHVLDRLFLMKLVDEFAREAGLKLHQDYVLARIEARLTSAYTSVRVKGHDAEARLERSAVEEAAYQRWRAAIARVPQEARDIVIHVCCIGHPPVLGQLARMKDGLFHLARHYGLVR